MAAQLESIAATTFSERKGSIRLASLPVKISRPDTPFSLPRITSSDSPFFSCSEKATTREPFLTKGTLSSLAVFSIRPIPLALRRALSVPGTGSKPPWIMALLAFVAPQAASLPFSARHILSSYRESSLASRLPTAPAPIIPISKSIFFLRYKYFSSPDSPHGAWRKSRITRAKSLYHTYTIIS